MKNGVRKEFKKQLKNKKEYVAIATINAKDYQKTNIKIIRHFTEDENIPGVYVTLSKPYKTVEKNLRSNGVDTRLIIFIDAVTKTSGGELKKTDNPIYFLGRLAEYKYYDMDQVFLKAIKLSEDIKNRFK